MYLQKNQLTSWAFASHSLLSLVIDDVQEATKGLLSGTVDFISAGLLKIVGDTLSGVCKLTGSHETCENVAFVVDLLAKLQENAAFTSILAHSDKTKR